ncbi:hypothetical protein [Aliiroseovarius sediminis]|uniref:hypothetical protein n=1 Tax=Aliiroseovarius sediminis TaxID=2925839 RepID=UPI001F5734F6|nr:hypothetical protein [Aliiroseovarius sediminis]MCI2392908.1 hypothetical protein [Aliiroseovarius sediminis]
MKQIVDIRSTRPAQAQLMRCKRGHGVIVAQMKKGCQWQPFVTVLRPLSAF